jgi:hypothetical protein
MNVLTIFLIGNTVGMSYRNFISLTDQMIAYSHN